MSKDFNIIAETAFSHEGNFQYLLKQVVEAKNGSADFVKFQVLLSPSESYCSDEQIAKAKKWIFTEEQWCEIFNYAKTLDLKIILLPLNSSTLDFCLKYDHLVDIYEVHSICFCEKLLLNKLKNTKKTIILGVGGRTLEEIDFVINKFSDREIILMTGFQSFPTDYTFINLEKIKTLKNIYNCKIGYADHTAYYDNFYNNLNSMAYLLGARFFEKHIILEKGAEQIDFESAISSSDFLYLRKELEKTVKILGNGDVSILNETEKIYRSREKTLVFNKNLKAGHILSKNDIFCKISSNKSDFEQMDLYKIIGKKLMETVIKNESVKFKHIGESFEDK